MVGESKMRIGLVDVGSLADKLDVVEAPVFQCPSSDELTFMS